MCRLEHMNRPVALPPFLQPQTTAMGKWYQFLTQLNPDLFMALVLALLFSAEQLFSRVQPIQKRAPHLFHNVLLQAGYFLVNFLLAYFLVFCLNWTATHKFGLFYHLLVPYWLQVITGVIFIDFINYWEHRLNHNWSLFWRLHRVHHSDTIMDSSTTYRFHPLDAVLDNIAALAAVFLLGIDGAILLLWLILYIPLLVLHHAAYIMPGWFDKTFGQVFVSPNIHKIHHHQEQRFTDSNYGLMFIIWDKLFGTYQRIPVQEIKFGLKEFDEPARQKFWFLLKSPFLNLKKMPDNNR